MATHSSVPAWRIPATEEPGGLRSRVAQSQTWLKWLTRKLKSFLHSKENYKQDEKTTLRMGEKKLQMKQLTKD